MKKNTVLLSVLFLLFAGYSAFAADSPEAVYKNYSSALKSKKVDEIVKYVTKENGDKMMAESPEDREMMIGMIAEFQPASIEVVGQTISEDGKTAALKLSGVYPDGTKTYGKVSMVKEGAEWKIDRDEWSNTES